MVRQPRDRHLLVLGGGYVSQFERPQSRQLLRTGSPQIAVRGLGPRHRQQGGPQPGRLLCLCRRRDYTYYAFHGDGTPAQAVRSGGSEGKSRSPACAVAGSVRRQRLGHGGVRQYLEFTPAGQRTGREGSFLRTPGILVSHVFDSEGFAYTPKWQRASSQVRPGQQHA